jgi:hypothetical protein
MKTYEDEEGMKEVGGRHAGRSGNGGQRPPISTKEPTFFESCNSRSCAIGQSCPACPASVPQVSSMVPQSPARSSMVQHGLARSRRCPANSRKGPATRNLRMRRAAATGGQHRPSPWRPNPYCSGTWHQRSLVIAASNTPPPTLSTCFRRGGGVF